MKIYSCLTEEGRIAAMGATSEAAAQWYVQSNFSAPLDAHLRDVIFPLIIAAFEWIGGPKRSCSVFWSDEKYAGTGSIINGAAVFLAIIASFGYTMRVPVTVNGYVCKNGAIEISYRSYARCVSLAGGDRPEHRVLLPRGDDSPLDFFFHGVFLGSPHFIDSIGELLTTALTREHERFLRAVSRDWYRPDDGESGLRGFLQASAISFRTALESARDQRDEDRKLLLERIVGAYIRHQLRKGLYPAELGQWVWYIVRDLGRPLDIGRELVADLQKLVWATHEDFQRFTQNIRIVDELAPLEWEECWQPPPPTTPPQAPKETGTHAKGESSAQADAENRFNVLRVELSDEMLARIDLAVQRALDHLNLPSSVQTLWDLYPVLEALEARLAAAVGAGALTQAQCRIEAKARLARTFSRGPLTDARGLVVGLSYAREEGARFVVDKIATEYVREHRRKLIFATLVEAIDPLDWPTKVRVVEVIKKFFGTVLPDAERNKTAEELASTLMEWIPHLISAEGRLRQGVEVLS